MYLVVHALPNLSTYKEIAYIQNGSSHNPPLISPDLWYWAVYGTFWLVGPITWLVVLVSLLDRALDKSWSSGFVKMQVIFWALVASFTAVILNRPAHYEILLAAPAWLIGGALADRLFGRSWVGSTLAMVRSVTVAVALILPVVTGVQYLMTNPGAAYERILREVGDALPAGKSVLAQQTYWFARPNEPYISWEQLVYYRRYVPGSTLEDAFRALKPDYLIVDKAANIYLVDDLNALDSHMDNAFLNIASSLVDKAEFNAFLRAHGEQIASIPGEDGIPIQVYKIKW
jgi:hypothetical protein